MAHLFDLAHRSAGLLLHPTSLPGRHGCGDLGPAAREFVDFLAAAGLRWWQMLPIGPPGPANSPYAARSAFAGSPLLISVDDLVAGGLLTTRDVSPSAELSADQVNYRLVAQHKTRLLRRAFDAFRSAGGLDSREYRRFCATQAHWLHEYAQYACTPAPDRPHARSKATAPEIDFQQFVQFQFDRQWRALRHYAKTRGVGLVGDVPIFVALESSDVWAHPDLFDVDAHGRPRTVSGVPPDLFSRTGQRWGHPHYRWSRHIATSFAWWVARFRRAFEQFDAVRIDHFLGFNRVWAVPGRAKTAVRGKWVHTPGRELFTTLRRQLGPLPIIAEDLGLLTPEAAALRDRFGFPGMRLQQFAFGPDAGSAYHLPHNHPRNCVVYPGTHDNDTTVGWLKNLRAARSPRSELHRLQRYVGADHITCQDVLRLVFLSPANIAIVPAQDILGLDNTARMNRPATVRGNWTWRLQPDQLTSRLAKQVRALAGTYGRA